MRRKRRSQIGIILRALRVMWHAVQWLLRHPQPVFVSGVLLLVSWGFWAFVQHSDAFRITEIHVPPGVSLKVPETIMGKNLWQVDVNALADEFKRQQPSAKEIRVVRQLPNALSVDVVPRVRVAQVHMEQWHPVDRDGFFFPETSSTPLEGLIRVVGLERVRSARRAPAADVDERLARALRVVEIVQAEPMASEYRVVQVDVTDPEQIHLELEGGTEVHCGSEMELKDHLHRLRDALRVIIKRQLTVQSIDVRFPEPVIRPRSS